MGDLDGKTCLVTGANRGLGLAVCIEFAKAGADVVMWVRDANKGEEAAKLVRSSAMRGEEFPHVRVIDGDLSSLNDTLVAAQTIEETTQKIDILVHCAAVYSKDRRTTKDGMESMFQTNQIGPFLLTWALRKLLKKGAPARVIIVSAPSTSALDFDDLQCEREWKSFHAFGASKMANILFTYELARRFEGKGVTATVVHPGLMKTDLMSEAPRALAVLLKLFSKRPEKAARAILYLATAPEPARFSGKFMKGTKLSSSDAYSNDPANQKRLWEASAKLAQIDGPGGALDPL